MKRRWSLSRVSCRGMAALVAFACVAMPVTGQVRHDDRPPAWVGHFTVLAANMVLGGLTAGVGRLLDGGRFEQGFAAGALGGVGVFAGKEITSRRFDGAGVLGREVAAVGNSIVRNASRDEPLFGAFYLPVGPFPFLATVTTRDAVGVNLRLKTWETGGIVYGLVNPHLSLDIGQSLSNGVATFRAENRLMRYDDSFVVGLVTGGVIFLADPQLSNQTEIERAVTAAHERVHVLQWDFFSTTWNGPVTEYLIGKLPFGDAFNRRATLDAVTWVGGSVAAWLWSRPRDRPIELEASFLAEH